MSRRPRVAKRPPAAAPPAPVARDFFAVVEHELTNGLKVRVLPEHSLPVVAYYTVFRAGSRDERPGMTGIAHLFEHMMFNGTPRHPQGDFDRIIEGGGGHINAYTSNDLTVYHEEIPPAALDAVVELEADRMAALEVTPSILETERQVVKEERRLRVDNDLTGMVAEELESLVFRSHPYRWPVIGWGPDLDAITREACVGFFRTYYAPNNAAVWVVGDVDPRAAIGRIERAYRDIPRGPAAPPIAVVEPPAKGERRAEVRHPAQSPLLAFGYPAPRGADDEALVLDVLQFALGQGDGSILWRSLVFEQELAVSVDVSWAWRIDPGLFDLFIELKPGVDPRRVESAAFAELDSVARRGLADTQLVRAKSLLRSHVLHELATSGGRANAFGTAEALRGTWRDVASWLDRYAAVTAGQVRDAARRQFDAKHRCVVTLLPEGGR